MKLQYVGLMDEYYGILMGLILFVAMVKMIKLLRFNNRFSQLILTLRHCWDDLSGFLVIFFLVFFSFVQVRFSQKGSKSLPKFTSENLKNKRLEDGRLSGSHF